MTTLGTAGHIDHGKTVLVRALTGVETDRLPEEQERGISIELGYAPLELPSGRRLSVVDVPGHERFVRTMVAGATGIDLFLLASGASDGHVAFNPPGSDRGSTTRIVELSDDTRRDNMTTFPDFRTLDQVPRHGLTVGISTIVDHSRELVMVVTGADKTTAFGRLTTAERYEPDWPATAFVEGALTSLYADRAAAGL